MAREGLDGALRTPSDRHTPRCIAACIVQTGPLNPTKCLAKKLAWRRAAMKISLKTIFEVESCGSSQGTQ